MHVLDFAINYSSALSFNARIDSQRDAARGSCIKKLLDSERLRGVGSFRHPLVTRWLSEGMSLTSALLQVVKARVALIEYHFLPSTRFDKAPA